MSEDAALDLASALERQGLAPHAIRTQLRAVDVDDDVIDAIAPAYSVCGIHESDTPVEVCSRCERARAQTMRAIDAQQAHEVATAAGARAKGIKRALRKLAA